MTRRGLLNAIAAVPLALKAKALGFGKSDGLIGGKPTIGLSSYSLPALSPFPERYTFPLRSVRSLRLEHAGISSGAVNVAEPKHGTIQILESGSSIRFPDPPITSDPIW